MSVVEFVELFTIWVALTSVVDEDVSFDLFTDDVSFAVWLLCF